MSWGGIAEESLKFRDNIIVFVLKLATTDSLTTTSKMSKSDEEEIILGSLKLSLMAIFFPLYYSGKNLKDSYSESIPWRRVNPNV